MRHPSPFGLEIPPTRLILSRHTELNTDRKLLVKQLKLDLPSQPPPRITAPAGRPTRLVTQPV